MKPILALLLCAFSAAAQVPPMPPEVVPRGPTSITDAENAAVRWRAAKTRQQQERLQATNAAPVAPTESRISLEHQPAVLRVRAELARQKLSPVRPSPPTPNPGRPVLRAPRQLALESARKRAESALHEPGPRPNRTK